MKDITIKDGLENMDFEKVTNMLSNAFWCKGIQIKEVIKGAEDSALVVGAFIDNINQIGFARVISDKTRFAYILDVYVDESFRKIGIGQKMVNYILNHEELKDVYQWLLITKDAHGVYSKVGFNPTSYPENWMEIRKGRPS
jgi:GNAT superfamily N-acetyltransferase